MVAATATAMKWIVPPLHPRSLQLLSDGAGRAEPGAPTAAAASGTCSGVPTAGAAAAWGHGAASFAGTTAEGEMDRCQGVVLLADCGSHFGGMAHSFATGALRDVHPDEAPAAAAPAAAPGEEGWDMGRVRRWEQQGINRGVAHALLSDACTAYLPIDAARWGGDGGWGGGNPVDAGALAAAALDSLLLPCRIDAAADGALSLHDWCGTLRAYPALRVAQT
eukprot:gene20911-42478_t